MRERFYSSAPNGQTWKRKRGKSHTSSFSYFRGPRRTGIGLGRSVCWVVLSLSFLASPRFCSDLDSKMVAAKVLCMILLLSSAWHAVVAQPTDIEPILPPIPDPPYPHSVRFCGIADNASFSLNASTLDQCDWKKYGMVRKPTFNQGIFERSRKEPETSLGDGITLSYKTNTI